MSQFVSRISAVLTGVLVLAGVGWVAVVAQNNLASPGETVTGFSSADDARDALVRAQTAAELAKSRAEDFDQEAIAATEDVERLNRESAAVAARIQQSEADILAANAQLAIVADQRRRLDVELAERQQPLVQLTGALQNMTRRPVVLSALQPGSLKDTVYLRAVLETALPSIREQTAGLRGDIERSRSLEDNAQQSLAALKTAELELEGRRRELASLTSQRQQSSRNNRALAQREAQRALALAEGARDLDELISEFDRASGVRRQLARLPGPIMRPATPNASRVAPSDSEFAQTDTAPERAFQLPAYGQTVSGFGEVTAAGQRNNGLIMAPTPNAQIVAPASGRIAFAGDYAGFGRIVIIEHENEMTSLIAGLDRITVAIGDQVIDGSPIGTAGVENPRITFELREEGVPINPLTKL